MNTSIKRFAAILFVASALSGAANAELDLVKFEKHADKANIDEMLSTMLMDIQALDYNSEAVAHVEAIFKSITKMLANKKNAADEPKIRMYVEHFTAALSVRVKNDDYANVVRVKTLREDLLKNLTKAGYFAGLRQKVGFAFDAAKTVAKTAPKTILGKLRGAQTKRTEDKNARPGKEAAFNTAFTAAVEKSLKDKKAVVKKELTELERLSAELCEVSNEEQEQAHDAELTATFEALDYAIKTAKNNDQITKEVARFEADKYGYIRNRGSKEKSAKNIAGLTAKIVKAQTDVKAKLEKVTLTAKNTVVTVLDALVKEAQAATVKCPVTQKTATK